MTPDTLLAAVRHADGYTLTLSWGAAWALGLLALVGSCAVCLAATWVGQDVRAWWRGGRG